MKEIGDLSYTTLMEYWYDVAKIRNRVFPISDNLGPEYWGSRHLETYHNTPKARRRAQLRHLDRRKGREIRVFEEDLMDSRPRSWVK